MAPALGLVYVEVALRVPDHALSQISVAGCLLQLLAEIEGLAWKSGLLDLDIESDGQCSSSPKSG